MDSKKSHKTKVLLVDDSESFVRVAKVLLRDFEIAVALDGEEALVKLEEFHPDVAFVDLVLPKISGLELIVKFKELRPDLYIIALTAIDDEETLNEVIELGAKDYLIKGALTAEALKSAIAKASE